MTHGPSADPTGKRLSVRSEVHPIDCLTFEGTIPAKEFGGGQGVRDGHLHLALHGRRVAGGWSLMRQKGKGGNAEDWFLVKDRAAAAGKVPLSRRFAQSVATGRTFAEIGNGGPPHPVGPVRKGATPRLGAVQLAEPAHVPREGRTGGIK